MGLKGLKKTISLNPLLAKTHLEISPSNSRRFYLSKGDPLGFKALTYSTLLGTVLMISFSLTRLFPISDLTVGISVGLFVLFVGMAIYIYKPRKRSVRGLYTAVDQPMPV